MERKGEHNNPKKIFREQDDLVIPSKKSLEGSDKVTSIRRSEITSIAPEDINWNNIYLGKKHGLHSTKPGVDSQRKGTI
ncbi:hypothetical protein HZA56_13165 [Candidatus Poribacteria bacterium]|nr:hypothetical protein [Candidatus Poribacteria bacterium]